MMDWVLKNPKRLLYERVEISALEKESWFRAAVWRLTLGLEVEVDVDMFIHGTDYPVTLTYTDLFPDTAAYIRPRDGSHQWSGHQYGPSGTLCLEWREDSWNSEVTGADLLRSAYKLLSCERHPDQRQAVPSAHRLTQGQELRSSDSYRLMLSPKAMEIVMALPNPGSMRLQTATIFHNGPSVTFVSQVEEGGALSATSDLPSGLTSYSPLFALIDEGHAIRHQSFADKAPITSPDDLEIVLRRAGFPAA